MDEDKFENSDSPKPKAPENVGDKGHEQIGLLDFGAYSKFEALLPNKRRGLCITIVVIALLIVAAIVVTVVLVTRKHTNEKTTTISPSISTTTLSGPSKLFKYLDYLGVEL